MGTGAATRIPVTGLLLNSELMTYNTDVLILQDYHPALEVALV